jgi:maltose O-acetyltransferase
MSTSRHTALRRVLRAPDLTLYFPFHVRPLDRLVLGRNVVIGAYAHIAADGGVSIGDNSMLASAVQITSSTHDYHVRPYRSKRVDAPVVIGANVWIGAGAIVLPGVTVGDDSVIGAGSVVTRDVPPGTVVAGAPARTMRTLEDLA